MLRFRITSHYDNLVVTQFLKTSKKLNADGDPAVLGFHMNLASRNERIQAKCSGGRLRNFGIAAHVIGGKFDVQFQRDTIQRGDAMCCTSHSMLF